MLKESLTKAEQAALTAKFPALAYFGYAHLPERLQHTSRRFHDLAWDLVAENNDFLEAIAGLRKLLEAKDCFVRAELPATASPG